MRRNSAKRLGSKLINVWVPSQMLRPIDCAVQMLDTDRSKFIRTAVREKLQRVGVVITDDEPVRVVKGKSDAR